MKMHKTTGSMQCTLMDQQMTLHPDKAMYWHDKDMLILSDLHLGKTHHFRKNGIPLPGNVLTSDLKRLEQLIEHFDPEQVLFVGDLFHSVYNRSWEEVIAFFQEYPSGFWHLIPGNHDIMDEEQYARAGILLEPAALELDPFIFTHHTEEKLPQGIYNISGHVHPGVRMRGKGSQAITLPCFYFGEQNALLPAFGQFTGLFRISPTARDRVFAVADGEVIDVTRQKV